MRPRLVVALDDVSVTEWRLSESPFSLVVMVVALDDVSVTEWRFVAMLVGSPLL